MSLKIESKLSKNDILGIFETAVSTSFCESKDTLAWVSLAREYAALIILSMGLCTNVEFCIVGDESETPATNALGDGSEVGDGSDVADVISDGFGLGDESDVVAITGDGSGDNDRTLVWTLDAGLGTTTADTIGDGAGEEES
jgi:hypothetical protein